MCESYGARREAMVTCHKGFREDEADVNRNKRNSDVMMPCSWMWCRERTTGPERKFFELCCAQQKARRGHPLFICRPSSWLPPKEKNRVRAVARMLKYCDETESLAA